MIEKIVWNTQKLTIDVYGSGVNIYENFVISGYALYVGGAWYSIIIISFNNVLWTTTYNSKLSQQNEATACSNELKEYEEAAASNHDIFNNQQQIEMIMVTSP